jgi:hypothetical protein
MSKISDAFYDIAQPESDPTVTDDADSGRFSAKPVPGSSDHRIGKDAQGRASLLISVSDRHSATPSPLRLEHLAVRHGVRCLIQDQHGNREEKQFTLITCLTQSYTPHFLRIAETILETLGSRPTRREVDDAVETLAELFESLGETRQGSVQGVWSELLVIANSSDPQTLISAWHSTPEDRYDFNSGSQRVEVKSTFGSRARHRFSLEQLTPPVDVRVLILSVRTERAGGGTSLNALVNRIRARVSDPEKILKVERVISASLGSDLYGALEVSFDEEVATSSLQIFASNVIPTPSTDLPSEVSHVKFTSDLESCPPVEYSEVEGEGGIFSALPTFQS